MKTLRSLYVLVHRVASSIEWHDYIIVMMSISALVRVLKHYLPIPSFSSYVLLSRRSGWRAVLAALRRWLFSQKTGLARSMKMPSLLPSIRIPGRKQPTCCGSTNRPVSTQRACSCLYVVHSNSFQILITSIFRSWIFLRNWRRRQRKDGGRRCLLFLASFFPDLPRIPKFSSLYCRGIVRRSLRPIVSTYVFVQVIAYFW